PVPTATVDPIDLDEPTDLLAAMPGTVLEFALAEATEHEPFLDERAVEAWRLVYDDGGGRAVVVLVGQWADAEDAATAMADRLAALYEEAPDQADADAGGGATAPSDVATGGETAPADGTGGANGPAPLPVRGAVEVDGEQV